MKIKKIMLINPSNTMPKDSVRRLTTPLGLLYMGAVLRDKGYDVNVLDSTCEGYYNTVVRGYYLTYGLSADEMKRRISDYKPDIVGITSMFTAQQKNVIEHCDLVKSVDKDMPVVIGGIHPSLMPYESAQNNSVDYVIMGEGEYRFLDLVNSLNAGKTDFNFDGIAYKKEGKGIVINPATKKIEDLDALPLPAREMIDMQRYIEIGVPFGPFARKGNVEQIMTSRGCPFDCNFCSTVKYWGRQFRKRSVENIIEEVEQLVNVYGIEELQFSDDNVTADKNRAKELFKALKKYNLSWCTPNGLMVQTVDEEMIRLMAESGAYQLSFAIESGSQRVLKEIIGKKVPPKEEVKKLIETCHKYDIQVHGMLIVGFPGEKREDMEETFQYPFETGLDSASFFIANPMPGSRLYYECKEKGYLDEENYKGNVKNAEINIPPDSPDFVMPTQELESLVDEKARKFNEFTRVKYPDSWDTKYKQFLKRHGDKADLILGRVT